MGFFRKTTISREIYVMDIMGHEVPLEFFSNLIKAVSLTVFILIGYNLGVSSANEYIKWTAAFHGIYNPTTHLYTNCWPTAEGNQVKWQCENSTVKNNQFVNPLENLTLKTPSP